MTAKDYINRMLDTVPVEHSEFRMVAASDEQVEIAMIAYAREKVEEALKATKETIIISGACLAKNVE